LHTLQIEFFLSQGDGSLNLCTSDGINCLRARDIEASESTVAQNYRHFITIRQQLGNFFVDIELIYLLPKRRKYQQTTYLHTSGLMLDGKYGSFLMMIMAS
jgi:hypothetical protein